LHKDTNKFRTERGVCHTISPKLFTILLEYMYKCINWDILGINIDGEVLNHLKFADNTVLITDRWHQNNAWEIASRKVGLKSNPKD